MDNHLIHEHHSIQLPGSIIPMQSQPTSTTHKKVTVREYDADGRVTKETITEETTKYSNGSVLPGPIWATNHIDSQV